MWSSAWTDLNTKGDKHKLHDLCGKDCCECQKLNCFTPKQFQTEGDGFNDTMIKLFHVFQTAGNNFLKQAVNTVALL